MTEKPHIVVRLKNKKLVDICQDFRQNSTFNSLEDAVALVVSLEENATPETEYKIFKQVA